MAMALDCSSLRWVSSIRSFWLRSVFTCTGAIKSRPASSAPWPRASLRSVLLILRLHRHYRPHVARVLDTDHLASLLRQARLKKPLRYSGPAFQFRSA